VEMDAPGAVFATMVVAIANLGMMALCASVSSLVLNNARTSVEAPICTRPGPQEWYRLQGGCACLVAASAIPSGRAATVAGLLCARVLSATADRMGNATSANAIVLRDGKVKLVKRGSSGAAPKRAMAMASVLAPLMISVCVLPDTSEQVVSKQVAMYAYQLVIRHTATAFSANAFVTRDGDQTIAPCPSPRAQCHPYPAATLLPKHASLGSWRRRASSRTKLL